MTSPVGRHWLVIHERGEDYSVEHPDGCPSYGLGDGSPDEVNGPICPVDSEVDHVGLDSLDVDWHELQPGRYEIRHWAREYKLPPHISWGSEWDCGLTIVSEDAAGHISATDGCLQSSPKRTLDGAAPQSPVAQEGQT